MRRMLGLAMCGLLAMSILATHGPQHAAEAGREAEAEEREHEPRRGAELPIEIHPDQQADDDREAELEAYGGRAQVAVRASRHRRCRVDDGLLEHGGLMQLRRGQILRQIAAMPRLGAHFAGPWYHGENAPSIDAGRICHGVTERSAVVRPNVACGRPRLQTLRTEPRSYPSRRHRDDASSLEWSPHASYPCCCSRRAHQRERIREPEGPDHGEARRREG